jgi:hypothetical protein
MEGIIVISDFSEIKPLILRKIKELSWVSVIDLYFIFHRLNSPFWAW